jgi:transposase
VSSATATQVHEIPLREIEQLLARAQQGPMSAEDRDLIWSMAVSYVRVGEMLKDKSTSIANLRKALFGPTSEKTKDVLQDETKEAGEAGAGGEPKGKPPRQREQRSSNGHGRNGADEYTGATRIPVKNEALSGGACCPDCGRGRVYALTDPGILLRVTGHPPIQAKVYELERLRCNLCGKVQTAKAPKGVGEEKYDASAASMIGLLRYGSGLPNYRLAGLQQSLGVPLPTSTQWDIVAECAPKLVPVYSELIRQAAQGELVHNDDTTMTILELVKKNEEKDADDVAAPRTGMFTTSIVALASGTKIMLFFSGQKHAGENLADLLSQRAKGLAPPMQMCDALSRNRPKDFEVILGNCLVHARRKFVQVVDRFPDECKHVIDVLRLVYKNDAKAKELGLSPQERLALHQTESRPLMDDLEKWQQAQLSERKIEPNSGLGQAIAYFLKHWTEMTLFLRQAGAPLDNNICESALKRAIMHRKNSLFYRTENGAKVGDVFMSLIHTTEKCSENPFEYLMALQQNADAVVANPAAWVPWKFRETLASQTAR